MGYYLKWNPQSCYYFAHEPARAGSKGLQNKNILNLNDFADLASYELIDKEEGIFRKLELDEDLVNQMIMDAREKSFS